MKKRRSLTTVDGYDAFVKRLPLQRTTIQRAVHSLEAYNEALYDDACSDSVSVKTHEQLILEVGECLE